MPTEFSWLDQFIITIDNGVRALIVKPHANRPNPAKDQVEPHLCSQETKQSASLMRINHTGEVCAQALYYGQALVAKSEVTKNTLLQAAKEETDHLAWCKERIDELHDHTSYLNPLWCLGAFSIGLVAGFLDDKWSLGFVVETERQVERHLQKHLLQLPPGDVKSRVILEQMCEDEAHHATVAMGIGAAELPDFIKKLMRAFSKIMTTTAYYL